MFSIDGDGDVLINSESGEADGGLSSLFSISDVITVSPPSGGNIGGFGDQLSSPIVCTLYQLISLMTPQVSKGRKGHPNSLKLLSLAGR